MRLKKDKSGDIVGRPSWRSSLPSDPGATFFCRKLQQMKNSLNFANTCLKVVDTRRQRRHKSSALYKGEDLGHQSVGYLIEFIWLRMLHPIVHGASLPLHDLQ